MVEPHDIHWIGAKNILRYIWCIITHGLRYIVEDVRLRGYSDVYWASSVVDHNITSSCCFSLGYDLISLMSKEHKLVALSTAKEK